LVGALAAGGSVSPASSKVVLRVGWTAEPDNLNPFIGYSTASYEVWALNYDTLVGYSVKDLTPAPTGLALSWESSQDGRVCTFHLRQGVTWQDGQPFTAADVAWTYNYIISNRLTAYTQSTAGITEVTAVDPSTVKIVCAKPKADLLSIWVPILPKHIWQNVPPKVAGTSYQAKLPIVGTGAFQCVAFKKGDYVELVANKQYFLGAPHIDTIVFQDYQSADSMTNDFKLGSIDAATGLLEAQFETVSQTKGLTAITYNYRNWDYLCMNCSTSSASLGNPVLRDVRFRRALNWAIDRNRLAAVAWSGHAKPGTTILPPGEWLDPDYHWQPPAGELYTYDPAKAAQELDAAGFTLVNGVRVDHAGKPIVLRLFTDASSNEQQTEAKFIATELQQLGLRIELQVLDSGAMSDRVWSYSGNTYTPDFDLYVWDWDGYFDPGQTLASFISDQIGGWNEPCWSNPEFDRLCAEQDVTVDPAKRQQLIWRMQQVMYQDSPEIVLTYPEYLQGYDTAKWTGWTRILNGTGPAFFVAMNNTYLNLELTSQGGDGRSFTSLIVTTICLAAIVVGLVVWVVVRRHRRQAEE
jgi:peptide/nickel transport system substrate-binding protein